MGGTELYASRERIDHLEAEDFNECSDPLYHDCSEHAHCFNLRGTYTCSCKEGFADLSENILYPGRICSAELIGCELCNYHGTCYTRGEEQVICECFQWYAGHSCHINLKGSRFALKRFSKMLMCMFFSFIDSPGDFRNDIIYAIVSMYHPNMLQKEATASRNG